MEDENGIMFKLGELVALVKANNDKLDKFIEDTKDNHKNHEDRISSLEKGQIKLFTIAGAVSFVISLVTAIAGILWQK
jgi:hypothetical protein